MADEVLAKVSLPHVSGLPRDSVVTDWSFLAADLTDGTLDGIGDSIVSFFNTDNGAGEPVAYRIGGQISRTASAARIDYYAIPAGALDGTGPIGSPVYTQLWTVGAVQGGAAPLPDEVALKMTVLADGWDSVPETEPNPTPPPAKIRPRARYRGGVFLGPWTVEVMTTTGNVSPRPTTAFITDLAMAADRFMDERGGDYCIWSRRDAVFRLVAPGGLIWCDNAFDTIRKRGVDATVRSQLWP